MPSGDMLETAVGAVLVKHPDGATEETSEEVLAFTGKGPYANIGVRARTTINLGNYENISVEVSIHVPCETKHGAILEAFEFAAGWLDERMESLVTKYSPKK